MIQQFILRVLKRYKMKNLKSLLKPLWNSKKDSYSECKHPILQRTIDCLKETYARLNSETEKGYYRVMERDVHLQSRKTKFIKKKRYQI